ncbi:MAG: family 31 glucosidase [Verrucomicrobia bacterium]|nr:family 31 glucosidase [Verrucomicrobiota bacterium]
MKDFTTPIQDGFIWHKGHEHVWIVPWGRNGLRVRVTHEAEFRDLPNGLFANLETPDGTQLDISDAEVKLVNGDIRVTLSGPLGQLAFSRTSDGETLLRERAKTSAEYKGRTFLPGSGTWKIEQRFFADDSEKIYGLGQRQHGYLDQKGCVLDLLHRNTEVSIPFMVSSKGYGFLWNYPGVGRVELGRNETRWVAEAAHQIDYFIVIEPTPAALLKRYAEATGFPSAFPEWAAGFWQCKLRYKTQDELLTVAREYHRRKLPVSVMVIDFHHWTKSGDWSFDPQSWPDPAAMVQELKGMGMELMVSIWPTVNLTCDNYATMRDHGLVIRNERGMSVQNGASMDTFYDATNPAARAFIWEKVREGYVKHGIKRFWLDTMEPELVPLEQDNTRYYLGNGMEVSGLYPRCHQQAFYEGLRSEGETAPLTLGRSAWVGSQRYGSAVWSADIPSTFESLRLQIAGGLNIGISGIPWWTTDIGGFHGGDIEDPEFRELLVRWFQYGVFCPIMRLHGVRQHKHAKIKPGDPIANPNHPNVPNEVWSYGEDTGVLLSEQIHLRERLRPYIMEQMSVAQSSGLPPMRPLFLDYPDDPHAWQIENQFLFGPDILVAPIVRFGARSRSVYLPAGSPWRDAWTGKQHHGGSTFEADAPLARIPVYLRAGCNLQLT